MNNFVISIGQNFIVLSIILPNNMTKPILIIKPTINNVWIKELIQKLKNYVEQNGIVWENKQYVMGQKLESVLSSNVDIEKFQQIIGFITNDLEQKINNLNTTKNTAGIVEPFIMFDTQQKIVELRNIKEQLQEIPAIIEKIKKQANEDMINIVDMINFLN